MRLRHDFFPLVIALALTACTAETIPVRLTDASRPRDGVVLGRPPAEVYEAGLLLGWPVELVDWRYGAIRLELVDTDDIAAGRSYGGLGPCVQYARAISDPGVIAHELGHALGLGHTDGTLMAPVLETTELTDWQYDEIDAGVELLGACR